MPYVAKPDTSDVILNVSDERGEISVNLYLREGADGQGATVFETDDAEARDLFEGGFLKSGSIGRLRDSDAKLLDSAFEYAQERGLGALGDFQARVGAIVAEAEALSLAKYAELDADKDTYPDDDEHRVEDLADHSLGMAMRDMSRKLAVLSDARLQDVEEHLRGFLHEQAMANEPAPAPGR